MLTHNIYSQDVFMADVFQICAAVEFDIAAARIPILPDIQRPEIDFRSSPSSRRSRDLGWTSAYDPKGEVSRIGGSRALAAERCERR